MPNPGDIAIRYHERTKHHFHRYARSLGYLDWDTQPDPFRRFAGAPLIELPFRTDGDEPAYDDLFTPGAVPPTPINLNSIASLFELSLGLSSWKEFQGSRWTLRINPSSGNLHPTEGYLIAGPVTGLSNQAGVYHYAPKEHALERRAAFPLELWNKLIGQGRANLPASCRSPSPLRGEGRGEGENDGGNDQCLIVALTSIHWREAWKYGERAYRYCQEDAGHALAAVALSAALNGWHAALLTHVSDEQISTLLGLDRADDFANAEQEHPDLLIAVSPHPEQAEALANASLSAEAIRCIAAQSEWTGRANRLSRDHVQWDAIDEVAAACVKSNESCPQLLRTEQDENVHLKAIGTKTPLPLRERGRGEGKGIPSAARIIRQRRSAVAFDGETSLPADQFLAMLARTMPVRGTPLSALGPPVCIHLGLFVHRVTGLEPGLYCLPRSPRGERSLREAMHPNFAWQKPPACPSSLSLFLLEKGNVTRLAAQVSCGQDIAGDSAFSLGFIAEFADPLRQFGDWFYRRLHWEAGAIAQILYLEAEAVGLRATGIGCFFDDPVHEVFGLRDTTFQSLYHFTLGGPVEDTRLSTEPPYPPDMVARKTEPSRRAPG